LKRSDSYYIEIALDEARRAFRGGFSPVGAVLVGGETIISIQQSTRQIGNVYHAELKALLDYQEKGIIYPDVTLYSTLEPCVMCVGMAAVMKIRRVAWIVDDIWAGVSRVYNFKNEYVRTRFPKLDALGALTAMKDIHSECLHMWSVYLAQTGHSDAIHFMLGVNGENGGDDD
jgi:tRNA(adenine34) deaminase